MDSPTPADPPIYGPSPPNNGGDDQNDDGVPVPQQDNPPKEFLKKEITGEGALKGKCVLQFSEDQMMSYYIGTIKLIRLV